MVLGKVSVCREVVDVDSSEQFREGWLNQGGGRAVGGPESVSLSGHVRAAAGAADVAAFRESEALVA